MKRCTKCKVEKPVGEFNKNKTHKDGLQCHCKCCQREYAIANREKNRERSRQYAIANREKNRERSRQRRLKRPEEALAYSRAYLSKPENKEKRRIYQRTHKYGLTPADYYAMVAAQEDLCKLCDKPFDGVVPCVDHCHSTGRVRGLLCMSCNIALGWYENWYQKRQKQVEEYLKETSND